MDLQKKLRINRKIFKNSKTNTRKNMKIASIIHKQKIFYIDFYVTILRSKCVWPKVMSWLDR